MVLGCGAGHLLNDGCHVSKYGRIQQSCNNIVKTRVTLNYVTIQNRILKLNFKFLIWIKVSNFNLFQFVLDLDLNSTWTLDLDFGLGLTRTWTWIVTIAAVDCSGEHDLVVDQ